MNLSDSDDNNNIVETIKNGGIKSEEAFSVAGGNISSKITPPTLKQQEKEIQPALEQVVEELPQNLEQSVDEIPSTAEQPVEISPTSGQVSYLALAGL